MIVLICEGDTLGTYCDPGIASREARFAANLFRKPVELFNLSTKERVIWN